MILKDNADLKHKKKVLEWLKWQHQTIGDDIVRLEASIAELEGGLKDDGNSRGEGVPTSPCQGHASASDAIEELHRPATEGS